MEPTQTYEPYRGYSLTPYGALIRTTALNPNRPHIAMLFVDEDDACHGIDIVIDGDDAPHGDGYCPEHDRVV